MFYGLDITYDDRSASEFGLQVINFDTGKQDKSFTPTYSILEEKARSRDVPHFFGVETGDPLEFSIILGSEEELDRYDKNAIARWVSQKEYKRLVVDQEDLENLVYFAICESSKTIEVGGMAYAIQLEMRCNAHYPYEEITETLITTTANDYFTFYSPSGLNEYVYPTLTIENPVGLNSFVIKNNTDDNTRLFEFENLVGGESIIVDNDLGLVSGDATFNDFSAVSKWFRLVPEDNTIRVIAAAGMTITVTGLFPIIN